MYTCRSFGRPDRNVRTEMIKKLYDELMKKYEGVDARVYVSDGTVGIRMKTLSEEAAPYIEELGAFGEVFREIVTAAEPVEAESGAEGLTGENQAAEENLLSVVVEIDEALYQRLSDYAEHECRESEKEVFHHGMPCPGIRVYEIGDGGAYYLSNWRGKAFMLTEAGSNRVAVIAAAVTVELHGLIKHLGSAPFVFSGSIHLMHGTSIHYKDKNIIIAAESGHGKTTFGLLFGLDDGALISEDISYITGDSGIVNTGSKNYITIRKGTLYAFRDHFSEYCPEENVSPMELYQAGEDESVRMGLDILRPHSEQGANPEPMELVIVPVIDGDFSGFEISPLTGDEIREINGISNRDYNVDWLAPMLAFPGADTKEVRNNGRIRNVPYVWLHTDFSYREHFESIVRELWRMC